MFLLGIWTDFDELESALSLQELFKLLEIKRKQVQEDRKFLAAIQGIDLDKNAPKNDDVLERLREKVAKKKGRDPNDITSLRGAKAREKGFGIGMGLSYEVVDGDGNVKKG